MKKIILLVLFIAIFAGAIFVFFSRDYWWQKYLTNRYLREFNSLEEAYRLDANGGGTPEETLELLIKALEAKDAKLASSYFVPEKRKQMVGEFASVFIDKNKILKLISELKSYEFKKIDKNMGVAIFYSYDQEGFFIETVMSLNRNNNKWLIKDL